MKRNAVLVLFALLLTAQFRATPDAAAATYTAASCDQSAVGTLINGPVHVAVAGDTIMIPAGTCTWTSPLTVNKAITLQGAGAGTTTVVAAVPSNLFQVTLASATDTFRLTGITILPSSPTVGGGIYAIGTFDGTCNPSTCSHLRLDHITTSGWQAQHYVIDHSEGNFTGFLMAANNMFGVLDHWTVTWGDYGGIFLNIGHGSYGGVGVYGDNSWAQAESFGADNALYLEDNTFDGKTVGMAITDSDRGGGSRFVGRFNTLTNANFQTHGTESTGRTRGARQLEIYNNALTVVGSYTNELVHFRSGTGLVFNNKISASWFKHEVILSDYRIGGTFAPWGYCGSDLALWDDKDGVVYASGTIASTTLSGSTLTVVDTSKSNLNTFFDASNTYFIVDTTFSGHPAAEITSATSNSVTSNDYDYWRPGTFPAFRVGDTYQIRRTKGCIDQPGYGGPSTYLSGDTPSPSGWVNEPIRPVYEWGSTYNNGTPVQGWIDPNWVKKFVAGVHYRDQASGTSTGTSLPASCTTGMAYWKTNEGSWNQSGSGEQGRLYVCTPTSTWTPYYTPYTYPHPLVTGNGSLAPPASPTNVHTIR